MKTKLFIPLSLLISVLLFSCSRDNKNITPSSTVTSHDYTVTGYNQIRVEDAFNVEIQFSNDEESIIIEANDNLHQYIIVQSNLNELYINIQDNINLNDGAILKVYITTDHIFAYRASGAVSFQLLDTINAGQFEINLSGASTLSGTLMGGEINSTLSGASGLNLNGFAEKFIFNASGASTIESFDFQTDWLNTHLSGASTASLTINNKLDVWASGASTVYYKGEGVIETQDLSGGSQIIKVD